MKLGEFFIIDTDDDQFYNGPYKTLADAKIGAKNEKEDKAIVLVVSTLETEPKWKDL